VPWDLGIDGPLPGADGYATDAAAKFIGGNYVKALPDNGVFAATAEHPEIVLNYKNSDHTSPQMARIPTNGSITIPVPMGRYKGFYTHLHSAEGQSPIEITMNYADGSKDVRNTTVIDYGNRLNGNLDWSYVAVDLAKWNRNMTVQEAANHWLYTYNSKPNGTKDMVSVIIRSVNGKTLVFWGATGVAM
jgi:hypothetical protein